MKRTSKPVKGSTRGSSKGGPVFSLNIVERVGSLKACYRRRATCVGVNKGHGSHGNVATLASGSAKVSHMLWRMCRDSEHVAETHNSITCVRIQKVCLRSDFARHALGFQKSS